MSNLIRVNNRMVEEQKAVMIVDREEEIVDIDVSSIEDRPGVVNEFSDPLRQSIIAY